MFYNFLYRKLYIASAFMAMGIPFISEAFNNRSMPVKTLEEQMARLDAHEAFGLTNITATLQPF